MLCTADKKGAREKVWKEASSVPRSEAGRCPQCGKHPHKCTTALQKHYGCQLKSAAWQPILGQKLAEPSCLTQVCCYPFQNGAIWHTSCDKVR